MDLGEFAAELGRLDAPAEADTFRLFGYEFTLRERISTLPALRFAYNAKSVIAADERARAQAARAVSEEAKAAAAQAMAEVELTANAGLYAYLRDMIVPEEWGLFEQVAADAGLGDEELLAIASKIMAAVSGRPTRRSSGSPPGPSTTGGTSPDASPSTPPSPAPPDPPEEDEAVTLPVVTAMEGVVTAPAADLTDLERARAQIRGQSVPVEELVRSGG